MNAGWIGLWLLLGLQGVTPEESAGRAWARGDKAATVRLLRRSLGKAPSGKRARRRWQRKHAGLYYLAGRVALRQSRFKDAVSSLRIAARFSTFAKPYVLFHLGRAYQGARQPSKAIGVYLRLLRLQRSLRWKRRVRPQLVEAYRKVGQWRPLLRLLSLMIRYSRYYGPLSKLRHARCEALTGLRRKRAAIACWRELALLYPRTSRERAAFAALRLLKQEKPVWSPAERLARMFRLRRRFPAEIQRKTKRWWDALQKNKKAERGWKLELLLLRARMSLDRGQFGLAAKRYRAVVKKARQPFYVKRALLPLAKALVEGGKSRAASEVLHRYVEEFPEEENAPLRAYRAAWLALKAGQLDRARRLFVEFRTVYPRHKRAVMARWYEAWTWFRRGWYRKAIRGFRRWRSRKRTLTAGLRASYWTARANERWGRVGKAVQGYRALVVRAPFHLYAIWARLRLQALEAPLRRLLEDSRYCLLRPSRQRRWDPWSWRQRRAFPKSWLSAVSVKKTKAEWRLRLTRPKALLATRALLPASLMEKGKIALRAAFPSLPKFCRDWRKCVSLRQAKLFSTLGLVDDASEALFRGRRQLGATSRVLQAVRWLRSVKAYNESVRLMIRLRYSGRRLPLSTSDKYRLLYPVVFSSLIGSNSRKHKVPTMFSLAIMREESRFLTRVASKVGARGLMQIYPPTGRKIAKQLGLKGYTTVTLYTPKMNVFMGTWYLGELLKKFEGHVFHAAGGYNAGPHRVARWLQRGASLPSDVFTEEIPFRETRRYVKRVYHSYVIYSALYRKQSPRPPSSARVKVGTNINY